MLRISTVCIHGLSSSSREREIINNRLDLIRDYIIRDIPVQ
jgi:hypothetical protein